MTLIPLWQNMLFNKPNSEWADSLEILMKNYKLVDNISIVKDQ